MALRLSLRPHEKIILAGAVVRNGDNRAEIFIENEVPVMRESDILSPHAVHTPCERIYLALQLLYVDPARAEEHRAAVAALIDDVQQAAPSCRGLLAGIADHAAAGRLYQALKSARTLIARERELMNHVSDS